MVVFVLWLIMRMGYQLRLPWFMGGLERAPGHMAPAIEHSHQRHQPIEHIQDVPPQVCEQEGVFFDGISLRAFLQNTYIRQMF